MYLTHIYCKDKIDVVDVSDESDENVVSWGIGGDVHSREGGNPLYPKAGMLVLSFRGKNQGFGIF